MWTRMNEIERLFDAMDFFRNRMSVAFPGYEGGDENFGWALTTGSPRTNLHDKGEAFKLVAELPGLSKEDLTIKIQGNYLEISGERKDDIPEGYNVHRRERKAASFTRSLTLPADVDADRIEASLIDGLLILVLPKAEAAKPKQITIS